MIMISWDKVPSVKVKQNNVDPKPTNEVFEKSGYMI